MDRADGGERDGTRRPRPDRPRPADRGARPAFGERSRADASRASAASAASARRKAAAARARARDEGVDEAEQERPTEFDDLEAWSRGASSRRADASDGEAARTWRGGGEPDPMRGPEGSPWVRHGGAHDELGGAAGRPRPALPDLSALLVALEGLRALVPSELSDQLRALVRELLLTLRSLIDWYLERLEGGPREPEVEDIPLD